MIYTEATKKAMNIMFQQHKDQKDKSGQPYVFHPFLVAEAQTDETRTIVALLHDVVEDTDMTFEDLKKEGFSNEVIEALKLLTHNYNIDYFEYIKKIATNPIALDVKLADLKHNSDTSRLNKVTPVDIQRKKKYDKCIEFLELKKKMFNKHDNKDKIKLYEDDYIDSEYEQEEIKKAI